MISSIQKRFIALSTLVIGCVAVLLVIFTDSDVSIAINMSKERPIHGYIFAFSIFLLIIFAASWLLSKIAIRPVKAAWQKQLDFTADASHELRTPIAVIQTNLELVLESPNDTVASQMKWLQNIAAETQRMTRLVEDLLMLSRADTNQQTLEKESFMLDELCKEVLAPFTAIAQTKGIALKANLADSVAFCGDKKRMKQLIAILLDHALHYTSSGTVTLTLSQSEKALMLTVTDTGIGIATPELGRIFERFYRAKIHTNTRKMHPEGSGLGLPIAKWIVKEHNGTITAESVIGRGSSFAITLPM
ncbi:MAG: HAMP domain-containing histidine kinase [Deferribacteraceae bacterium]|nr:HAMP domain-containing histidine kinase [Deferribacteraceae bacterium]